MAIERQSYIERVTIVLARDGTLKGAQQETIEELVEDGIVLSTRYAPASPLTAETLAGVLPDVAAALAATNAALARRIDLETP